MRQKIVRVVSLCSVLFLSCTGCAYWTGIVRAPIKDVSASQIIAALRDNNSGLKSFRGEANMHLQGSGTTGDRSLNHRLLAGILFESPARMRIEVYAGLGTNILTFVQKDNQLDVFLPKSNVLLTGDIRTDALAQATGIEGLLEMILETLGFYQPDYRDLTSFQKKRDEYILCFHQDSCRVRYSIDGRSLQVVRKEVFRKGSTPWKKVTFKEYARTNGIYLPRQVEIVSDELKISAEFVRQQVNVKIAGENFELKVPADARRIPM